MGAGAMKLGRLSGALARWRGVPRAAALRALAAAALALVLAGVYVRRPRPAGGACVVLAVDVSASVQQAGADAAPRAPPALERGPRAPHPVRAPVFARAARVGGAPARDAARAPAAPAAP